jgi:large conductance mechanosensitive channel
MSGFKNFLLRGNLVDLAVAVIIGTAFSAVVSAFTAWLTAELPAADETFAGANEGDLGFFLNALISFVVLAAVVYFLVVLPYTKARERYFPSPAPGTPEEIELLRQIRDALVDPGERRDPVGPRVTP